MLDKAIVFYCNWGVAINNGHYYLASVHRKYINEAKKHFKKVILVSKEINFENETLGVLDDDVEVFLLPKMNGYLSSFFNFFKMKSIFKLVSEKNVDSIYYIRSPEPFNWLFAYFLRNNNNIVFHFMSNPLGAIMNDKNKGGAVRLFRLCIYFPEFLLNILAARFNKISCNGLGLKNELSFFFGDSCKVLNESTINEDDILDCIDCKKIIKNKYDLLFVGYIRAAKGLDYLIDALMYNELYKNVNLKIVGDGEYLGYIRNRVFELGISSSVEFLGHIDFGKTLLSLYRESDMFVFPSLSEGSPRVVLEAMSQGVPVIATNVGNTKNLLKDERGICVEPKQSLELYEAIVRLMGNEELSRKFKENGLIFAKKNTLGSFMSDFVIYANGHK